MENDIACPPCDDGDDIVCLSCFENDILCLKTVETPELLITKHIKPKAIVFEKEIKPPASRNCIVCADDKRPSKFYRLSACKHSFCKSCWRQAIIAKVQDGSAASVDSMKCMEHDCNNHLDYGEIKHLLAYNESNKQWVEFSVAADKLMTKFDNMLLETGMSSLPNVEVCPNKACNLRFISADANAQAMITHGFNRASCPYCKQSLCLVCKQPVQPSQAGLYCLCALADGNFQQALVNYENNTMNADDRQRLEQIYAKEKLANLITDRQSERTVRAKKKCPNCGVPTEKSTGCDHMNCTRCLMQWNWSGQSGN